MNNTKKISFKPYHGIPYKLYRVFRICSDGTEKRISTMLAPNIDLALAKAKENYAATLTKGQSIIVEEYPKKGRQNSTNRCG